MPARRFLRFNRSSVHGEIDLALPTDVQPGRVTGLPYLCPDPICAHLAGHATLTKGCNHALCRSGRDQPALLGRRRRRRAGAAAARTRRQRRNLGAALPMFARTRRALAVDLRSAGRSEKPPGAFSIADCADDLARLLDALDLPVVDVVGSAFGWTGARSPRRRWLPRARMTSSDRPSTSATSPTSCRARALSCCQTRGISRICRHRTLSSRWRRTSSLNGEPTCPVFSGLPCCPLPCC